jgi:hypothetical protein
MFLSGGSGVTPVMSMTRTYADKNAPVDVRFIRAAHTPMEFVFRTELSLIARRMPVLRLVFIPERRDSEPEWPDVIGASHPFCFNLLSTPSRTRRLTKKPALIMPVIDLSSDGEAIGSNRCIAHYSKMWRRISAAGLERLCWSRHRRARQYLRWLTVGAGGLTHQLRRPGKITATITAASA